MMELRMRTREETDMQGHPVSFDYFILVDEVGERGFACESYGVKIAASAGGEEVRVPHITTSVTRIDELIALLTRNFVTPTALRDVIDDWL